MTITTKHCWQKVAEKVCNCNPCHLTVAEKNQVEYDLQNFINRHLPLLDGFVLQPGIEFTSITELREAIGKGLDDKSPLIPMPLMEHHSIDKFIYSYYRALHDIIHHHIFGLGFNWQGEAASWELLKGELTLLGAAPITIAFVRHDVLYINAMYHYSRRVTKEPSCPVALILDDCTL